MDTYRTEEEQVEAIGRWWNENGRSIIISIVLALSAGFGWQAWKDHDLQQSESASHEYQLLLQYLAVSDSAPGGDYSEANVWNSDEKKKYQRYVKKRKRMDAMDDETVKRLGGSR